MKVPLRELARLVGGQVVGDGSTPISGTATLEDAQEGHISLLSSEAYFDSARLTRASALIVPSGLAPPVDLPVIQVALPDIAFAKIVELFSPTEITHKPGVHPTAIVAPDATLGKNVSIHPYCTIESEVRIGDETVLYPGVYIGCQAQLGSNCTIYPFVTVRERVIIGNNVIIHPGAVIGADGFGYTTADRIHHKIPQKGIVVIEDNVEIGANTTIDRARLHETRIGQGTKIDNLVQIAHNVKIGKHCLIVAGVMIAGSSTIGDYCVIAGQAGITDHVELGDGVIVSARAGVSKSIPSAQKVGGFPAIPLEQFKRMIVCQKHLPELLERIRVLEKRVRELEKTAENNTA